VPESRIEIDLIRACRARFGPPPRALAAADAAACRIRLMPSQEASYQKGADRLLLILADQELLLARGTVVWGHLVQANQILFDRDNERTAPANVIYSPDAYFDGRTDVLAAFARDLFAQKGMLPGDPEIGSFVRAVTDEYLRVMRRELPRSYSAGRPAYFATCFIEPHHLPDGYLARSEFPLLVNADETEAVMMLPVRFWPPELLARWRARPGRGGAAPAGQVRCPFCHRYIDEPAYPAHRAGHVKRRAEDRPADAAAVPPADGDAGDLAGVPAVYRHRACGAVTRVPAEIIRSYLRNPYLYSADRAFCCGCGEHFPLREYVWTETGEDLRSYTDRLRAARPEMKPGGPPPDPAEVVRRNRVAANRGDAAAMNDLGWAYEHGAGVPADPAAAVNWYRRAAAGGSAIGMSNLGLALSAGRGVPADPAEALQWLRRAADLGNATAMFNLGFAYDNGEGVTPDPAEAVRWYRKAAEAGQVKGMSSLGLALSTGRGVPADHAEAVKWLRRAAHLGSAVAMCNLGYAYSNGEGVAPDPAEAVKWYRKAAELGEAMAMNNLGSAYHLGKGVPADVEEAVRWYRKAAAKGHKGSAAALARLGR
jgi:TPR repeat protein